MLRPITAALISAVTAISCSSDHQSIAQTSQLTSIDRSQSYVIYPDEICENGQVIIGYGAGYYIAEIHAAPMIKDITSKLPQGLLFDRVVAANAGSQQVLGILFGSHSSDGSYKNSDSETGLALTNMVPHADQYTLNVTAGTNSPGVQRTEVKSVGTWMLTGCKKQEHENFPAEYWHHDQLHAKDGTEIDFDYVPLTINYAPIGQPARIATGANTARINIHKAGLTESSIVRVVFTMTEIASNNERRQWSTPPERQEIMFVEKDHFMGKPTYFMSITGFNQKNVPATYEHQVAIDIDGKPLADATSGSPNFKLPLSK